MKFDKKDKKLISYLYHEYRKPLSKIAKACRMSRDQVEYRIKKYEKEGLIRKYLTIFNYELLGYTEFVVVWLKLKSGERGKSIVKKQLENIKNVISFGDVLSNYDLFIDFVFKNKKEFEKVFYDFIEKNKDYVEDYSVSFLTSTEFFPLKEFGISSEEKPYEILGHSNKVKLIEKDWKILKVLEKNGRERIIDLAYKTGLSGELIIYKLKQYHKNKIILGMRILPDMKKLGFYFGVLRIKLKNPNEALRKRIKNFCKEHKNINVLSFGISDYNCLIQIFYQGEETFRKTLREINKTFEKEITKSQILLIENEGKVKTLPY